MILYLFEKMVAKRFELLHLTIPEDSTVNSVKM